jgi:ABC-type transport system involved in cytochrome c biogenesis permease subunit
LLFSLSILNLVILIKEGVTIDLVRFLLTFFTCIALLSTHTLTASPENEFPVLYKGRFRPAEAYARLWLYDHYHAQSIKAKDLLKFNLSSGNALNFLWKLHFEGHFPFDSAPLFWIQSAQIKKMMELKTKQNRFSYLEVLKIENLDTNSLSKKDLDEVNRLKFFIREFESHQGRPKRNSEASALQQLKEAGTLFHSIPSRRADGEWYSFHAFQLPFKNYTPFSQEQYHTIKNHYLEWEKSLDNIVLKHQFTTSLLTAYSQIAGTPYQEAQGKALYYPSLTQLKLESWYYQFPFIQVLILLYSLTAIAFLCSYRLPQSNLLKRSALLLLLISFIFHTGVLALRCYILSRPPVSNMSETVIYVPWVAVLASLVLSKLRNNQIILIASCVTSIFLLAILEITDLDNSLDQVQAVLDSQFWLIIHVLMVVGSYGVFLLGSLLGHVYLISYIFNRKETVSMNSLAQLILQTMYLGIALLIPGTILGGIWAAESWGRFWDWDPKESWAFISSCFYLIWVHAYRFNKIGYFGLAIGAVVGALAISFTWYGVNYILGTGLHSYGFGSGGEIYYYTFVTAELLLISYALYCYKRRRSVSGTHKLQSR